MSTLFGKLPRCAEFVREGVLELALEAALTRMVERGQMRAPARFLLAEPGACRIGAWIASEDALGRPFPLVLAHPISQGPYAALPLHYAELLDASEDALYARMRGAVASELARPHPSALLPQLHRARAALEGEAIRRFQVRTLATLDADALPYALSTLMRACRLAEPVVLELPSAREDALFAWLELFGLFSSDPPCVLWLAAEERAWLGGSMTLYQLLQLAQTDARWPLTSSDGTARLAARADVGADVCRLIDGDATVGELIALLRGATERIHAG